MARVIARADLESEVAALEPYRQLPPDGLYNRDGSFTVILDQCGVIVLSQSQPNEAGRLEMKLVCADRQIDPDALDKQALRYYWLSQGWALRTLLSLTTKESHLPQTLITLQALAEQLQRLRFGGWHFRCSDQALTVFNPLIPNQQAYHQYFTSTWLWRIRRASHSLQKIPTIPQRRASQHIQQQLETIATNTSEQADLTGLVQARWPTLTGVELAAAISHAFDRYSAGDGLTQAVEQACQS